jgi:gliding motility-associated-like protein
MKSNFLLYSVFVCTTFSVSAQGLTSVGAAITVENSASLTIQGDLNASVAGTIENSGLVQVENDITNSSGTSLFVNNLPGSVELNGNNQSIGGVDSISFNDLSLLGGLNSVKSLFVNIGVSGILDLDNQELQLHQNRAVVSNPNLNAISFLSGFVSGDSLGGYLVRSTNQSANYVYPVGSSSFSPAVRPVILIPATTSVNQFGVRMSDVSGNNDFTGVSNSGAIGPFDENAKQAEIGEINDLFYHNIFQFQGVDPADVQVLYSSFDGDFKTLSQWKSGQYINAGFVEGSASSFGLDKMMYKNGVIDFDHDVFALAELNTEIKVPGGISINDDGINDILVIEGLEFYPDNELQIFNRWGSLVFEAVDYQNNWDGTSDQAGVLVGDKLPTGTYFYILKLTDEKVLKGSLELKR